MKNIQNRLRSFPPTAEANWMGKKVGKRSAYNLAYFLLTFAYKPAYCPAYLQVIGRAGSRVNARLRPALWLEKFVRHSASCGLFQNRTKGNQNG